METSDSESDIGDPRLDTHKTSKSSVPPIKGKSPMNNIYFHRDS